MVSIEWNIVFQQLDLSLSLSHASLCPLHLRTKHSNSTEWKWKKAKMHSAGINKDMLRYVSMEFNHWFWTSFTDLNVKEKIWRNCSKHRDSFVLFAISILLLALLFPFQTFFLIKLMFLLFVFVWVDLKGFFSQFEQKSTINTGDGDTYSWKWYWYYHELQLNCNPPTACSQMWFN